MKQKPEITGRKVVISAVVINLVVGITYIWSMISRELITQFGWSSTQASLPYVVSLLVTPIMMIPAGYFADKGLSRLLAAIGGALFGIGFLICGKVTTVTGLVIGYGFCYGSGLGIQTAITTSTAMKWYSGSVKGRISGICLAGTALSSVYMSFLFSFLMRTMGLQRSVLLTGIVGMIIIMIASVFLITPSSMSGTRESQPSIDDVDWISMISTSKFRLTWIILVLADGSALMVIGNIATIASEQAGIANASVLIMLIALCNAIGRITIGALSDKIGVKTSFRIVIALQFINMLAFRSYNNITLLILGAIITGFAFGGSISLLNPTASSFGFSKLSKNAAILNTSYGVGGFVTPYIAAFIVDHSGSYNTAYMISAGMMVAAFIITFGLSDNKTPYDIPTVESNNINTNRI